MITKESLNQLYKELDHRANIILGQFISIRQRQVKLQYFNGHYSKNPLGTFEMEYYPIPVISVHNLCDIEINLDQIQITTKQKRSDIFKLDFSKIARYTFEIYGVNDYLSTYGTHKSTPEEIINKIMITNETNIAFSFMFIGGTEPSEIKKFTHFLELNHFYY